MQAREGANAHRNNFDLLRLGLALTVCLVHTYELSAYPALIGLEHWLSAGTAFHAFFVVSGYLIYASYERTPSLRDYFGKRARRIYPAYLCVVLACAFGLYFASGLPPAAYFNGQWLRYLLANLTFLNFLAPTLPGVFTAQNVAAVNGALWTIKIEVGFYLCLPLIVWLMRRLGPNRVLAAGFAASVAWLYGCWWMSIHHGPAWGEVARQLPGQFCLFAVGMALRHNQATFARFRWQWMAAAFLLCVCRPPGALAPLTDPLVLGVLAIGFATGPYVGYRAPLGDLSYGVYLWHFPIIQLLVASHAFDAQPWALVAVAVVLALVAALLSWHLVERRFLGQRGAGVARRVAPPAPGRQVVD